MDNYCVRSSYQEKSVEKACDKARQLGLLVLRDMGMFEYPAYFDDFGKNENMLDAPITSIDLSINLLPFIHPCIHEYLRDVEYLSIRGNKITEVCPEIFELPFLKSICLAQNSIKSIPSTFGKCPSLVVCDFSDNQIEGLESFPDTLEKINLNMNKIKELPKLSGKLSELYCEDNLLTAVSFANSPLTKLSLKRNKLTSVKITGLPELRSLDLSFNKLQCLVSALPIGSLKLWELMLSYNSFVGPEFLQEFLNCRLNESLRTLLIKGNKLTHPWTEKREDLQSFCWLATLDVSDNDIGNLPPQLALMPHLQHLNIRGNMVRPPSVCELTTGELLTRLRGRLKSKVEIA